MMPDTAPYRLQAALDLCETLLMPGSKARLSPYLTGLVPPQDCFLIPVYQSLMLDVLRSGYLPEALSLLDYDSPFAIGAAVVIDTLLAWQTACALYGVPIRLRSINAGLHNDPERGDTWKTPSQTLFARIRARAGQLPELAPNWMPDSFSPAVSAPNLLLVKFPWQKGGELTALLDSLPAGAIVAAVAWPRPDVQPAQLFAWRYQLLRERTDFVALGPCGQEYGRLLPAACQTCVHGRRMVIHTPGGTSVETPPWSYVLLVKRTEPVERPTHPLMSAATMAQGEIPDLYARYLGTVYEKAIVAAHPDQFEDNPANIQWHDYLRLCPGHSDVTRLVIEGNAGMSLPRLRYGQWLSLHDARPYKPYANAPDIGLLRLPNEATLHHIPGLPMAETFLPAYIPTTRAAVDEAAYRLFGFGKMYDFQHTILERVLCGGDIFAIAATGGGKSECYILPAILLPGLTVVVSPLKSLMQDQYDQRIRDRYGLDYLTTALNGDVKFYERQGRLRRMILGHFKLVYMTPEQLERGYVLDALRQANQTMSVRYLAMDEAHCISQWGHDFRPSYLNIVERLQDYDLHPRRIALTATASPRVRDDVCQELHLHPQALHAGGDVFIHTANRPELNLVVRCARTTEEKAQVIVNALRHLQGGSAIVFMPHTGGKPDEPYDFKPPARAPSPDNAGMVSTGVSPFAKYLERQLGQPIAMYHGAMDDTHETDGDEVLGEDNDPNKVNLSRREEQNRFMKGEKRVMVATKGFGMGIDKPDIRLVIHRSPTANLEAYAQEAGRAGRDGDLATVMLLFSDDRPRITKISPDDFLPREILQSDREIQAFFTEQRYVRRIDVEAMIAFLRTQYPRRVGESLYFTNDQVMAMLDACEKRPDCLGLSQPYQWPSFPARHSWSWESKDHKCIRDRGYLYSEKCKYIGRILKVLYNNRPTLNGQVIPLIWAAHETGIILRDFHLDIPERIIASPVYFGARLREAGIDVRELRELLPNGDLVDLTPLAMRLELSLRETVSMLYDIRSCEGRAGPSGRWVRTLLNYKRVEAPRWVYLPDPYDVRAWRDYAGAYTRKKGGGGQTLDDYFPDWTLNKPTGWEITSGDGLHYFDQHAYLDAFMTLHDERHDNDQSNFTYLIERYIGVNGNPQECLRSLLLGYLKTGEVIEGGKCFGCSVCVPDLNFERYQVSQRKSVVKHLMVETLTWLERLEGCNRQPPAAEVWQGLLNAIAQENALGRSGTAYLDSWLARVIQDDPEHQGALWLRLRAWEQDALSPSPADVVTALTRLTAISQPATLLADLQRNVARCLETRDYAPHRLTLLKLAAQLAGRRNMWAEEAELWQQVLDSAAGQGQDTQETLSRLLELYRRADRLNDAARAAEIAQRLIRLPSLSLATAQTAYGLLVGQWTWPQLEIALNSSYAHSSVALLAWPGLATSAGRQDVIIWLAQMSFVIKTWSAATLYEVAQCLQPELDRAPEILLVFADNLRITSDEMAVEFLLRAWLAGGKLSSVHLQLLAANLLKLDAATTRKRLASQPDAASLLSVLWQARGKTDFPLRWLLYFPAGTLRHLSEPVFVAVWTAFLAFKSSLEESVFDDLITRLGTSADAGAPQLAQVATDRPDWALQLFQAVLRGEDILKSTMFKALFPVLLADVTDTRQAILYLDALSKNPETYQDDARMATCLDVWNALQGDRAIWPLLRRPRVESDVLVNIAKKWLGYSDKPHRLDMLVIILQEVCNRSLSTWMTPISLIFQALCAAGRFQEAKTVVAHNPSLRIQGRDATTYLKYAQTQCSARQAEYTVELLREWRLSGSS
ncbi:MAG: ATP-dependent DNA helicase RecQ [Anaerolineae bacterium]|nr:ATP-dependent DNA helicase RecQ [Anaerolineae bacterium]